MNNRDYNKELEDNSGRKYAYGFDFDIMHPYMLRSFEPFLKKAGNALELGSSKGHLAHVFKSTSDQFNVEIYFPKDKTIIDEFIKDKDAIESEFGEKLDWQPLRDKVASRIALYRSGDLYKKEEWDEYSNWIIEKLLKFHEVFGKRLNNLE